MSDKQKPNIMQLLNVSRDQLAILNKNYIYVQSRDRGQKFKLICEICGISMTTVKEALIHVNSDFHSASIAVTEASRTLLHLPQITVPHRTALNSSLESALTGLLLDEAEVERRRSFVKDLAAATEARIPKIRLNGYGSHWYGLALPDSYVSICASFINNDNNIDLTNRNQSDEQQQGTVKESDDGQCSATSNLNNQLGAGDLLMKIFTLLRNEVGNKQSTDESESSTTSNPLVDDKCPPFPDFTSVLRTRTNTFYLTVKDAMGVNYRIVTGLSHTADLSLLIHTYLNLNKQAMNLAILFRKFAKIAYLDMPENGTFHENALPLLVIFYLQHRKIPLLPNVHTVTRDSGVHLSSNKVHQVLCKAGDLSFLIDTEEILLHWSREPNDGVICEPPDLADLWLGFLRFYLFDFKHTLAAVDITNPKPVQKKCRGSHLTILHPFDSIDNSSLHITKYGYDYIHSQLMCAYGYFGVPRLAASGRHIFTRVRIRESIRSRDKALSRNVTGSSESVNQNLDNLTAELNSSVVHLTPLIDISNEFDSNLDKVINLVTQQFKSTRDDLFYTQKSDTIMDSNTEHRWKRRDNDASYTLAISDMLLHILSYVCDEIIETEDLQDLVQLCLRMPILSLTDTVANTKTQLNLVQYIQLTQQFASAFWTDVYNNFVSRAMFTVSIKTMCEMIAQFFKEALLNLFKESSPQTEEKCQSTETNQTELHDLPQSDPNVDDIDRDFVADEVDDTNNIRMNDSENSIFNSYDAEFSRDTAYNDDDDDGDGDYDEEIIQLDDSNTEIMNCSKTDELSNDHSMEQDGDEFANVNEQSTDSKTDLLLTTDSDKNDPIQLASDVYGDPNTHSTPNKRVDSQTAAETDKSDDNMSKRKRLRGKFTKNAKTKSGIGVEKTQKTDAASKILDWSDVILDSSTLKEVIDDDSPDYYSSNLLHDLKPDDLAFPFVVGSWFAKTNQKYPKSSVLGLANSSRPSTLLAHLTAPLPQCHACGMMGHQTHLCVTSNDKSVSFTAWSKLSKNTPWPPTENQLVMLSEALSRLANYHKGPVQAFSRTRIIETLCSLFAVRFPNVKIERFGSCVNGFDMQSSDLDVCIFFPPGSTEWKDLQHTESALTIIKAFKNELFKAKYRLNIASIRCVFGARVPILKVSFRHLTDVDISFSNYLAISNSRMLNFYAAINPACRTLGIALKAVIKIGNIGTAASGGISSYACVIMLIHYLQQIGQLPVLQQLHDQKEKPMISVSGWNAWFQDDIEVVRRLWKPKDADISHGYLWLGFLRYYLFEFDHNDYVVSIRQIKLLTRFEKMWTSLFAVEDPFNLSHNLTKALSKSMLHELLNIFHKTLVHHTTFLPQNVENWEYSLFSPNFICSKSKKAQKHHASNDTQLMNPKNSRRNQSTVVDKLIGHFLDQPTTNKNMAQPQNPHLHVFKNNYPLFQQVQQSPHYGQTHFPHLGPHTMYRAPVYTQQRHPTCLTTHAPRFTSYQCNFPVNNRAAIPYDQMSTHSNHTSNTKPGGSSKANNFQRNKEVSRFRPRHYSKQTPSHPTNFGPRAQTQSNYPRHGAKTVHSLDENLIQCLHSLSTSNTRYQH